MKKSLKYPNMIKSVLEFDWAFHIAQELGRDPKDLGFLVAFSGGADSLALLLELHQQSLVLGFRLHAMHIDHGLRVESAQDLLHCQKICLECGIPFHGFRLDSSQRHGSLEAWARQQRYAALEKCRVLNQLDWILTAHHQDDQRETLIMRLERGSSLKGLTGIARLDPKRLLWRPWLGIPSSELKLYAEQSHFEPCVDLSNWDQSLRRNYWRHKGLELLMQAGVQLEHLDQIAAIAQKTDLWLQSQFEVLTHSAQLWDIQWLKLHGEDLDFCVEMYARLWPQISRQKLADWIEAHQHKPMTQGQFWPLGQNQWVQHGGDSWIRVNSTQKIVENEQFSELELHLGGELSVEFAGKNYLFRTEFCPQASAKADPFCTLLLFDQTVSHLTVRTRRDGDLFSPAPFKSSTRKLKKYLQEKQIPLRHRDQMLLVCLGQNVLWIPGFDNHGCYAPVFPHQACWKLELYVSESRLERSK